MPYVKVAITFLVSEDHVDGFLNALEDAVVNIWKEAPMLGCNMKIVESGVLENVDDDTVSLI